MRTAATLNSGIFDVGSTARLVSWFAAFAPGQWYGMNTVSGLIVLTTWAGQCHGATPRADGDQVAIGHAEKFGELRMHLAQWFRVLLDESGDASGLGARQVLADDATGGEPDRIVVVDNLGRLTEGHGMEAGLTVGMEELPAFEQAWVPGCPASGYWPEESHLVFDPLPRRALVVGGAAGGSQAELVEDLLGVPVGEVLPLAQALGDVEQDLPVEMGLTRRRATAALILMIRPSPLVDVPSSSSWSEPGSTTSA